MSSQEKNDQNRVLRMKTIEISHRRRDTAIEENNKLLQHKKPASVSVPWLCLPGRSHRTTMTLASFEAIWKLKCFKLAFLMTLKFL